jgi:hypothetical protein
MSTTISPVEKLKIGDIEVYLEDFGEGKGKIIISNTNGTSYSYYWNAMGSSLKDFLCQLNGDYLARCLLGSNERLVVDWKRTFARVRKFIKEELSLPFYMHMEFQYDMRRILRRFQNSCVDVDQIEYFVSGFYHSFIDRLDFHLIENDTDRKYLSKDFNDVSEVWHLVEKKESREYLWIVDFHKKLKKELQKAH